MGFSSWAELSGKKKKAGKKTLDGGPVKEP
jgi:hypothetical protein